MSILSRILGAILIYGCSYTPNINNKDIWRYCEVAKEYLFLNDSGNSKAKVYNVFIKQRLYGNELVILTLDTGHSIFEFNTSEIASSSFNDTLSLLYSAEKINSIKRIYSYIDSSKIKGVVQSNDGIIFEFEDCCPRVRIVYTEDFESFFKKEYSKEYKQLLTHDSSSPPWANKISDKLVMYVIRDQL